METFKKNIYGIALCLSIAIPAWLLGRSFPIVGGPVFGILFGMIVTLWLPKNKSLDPGIKYTSKKLLQIAIILLGFEMNLYNIIKVGGQSLMVMLFTLSSAFLTAWIVGKALGIEGKTATLIGVGTSICGGSAIAATAPVIKANDDEIAHSISTIFLFNVVAVFLFPALGHMLVMSDMGFGMWAGTAINDTSSVVAAAAAWSSAAGNDTALSFATIVKLTRTLMIVPITLVLAIHMSKLEKQKADKNEKNASEGNAFSIVKVFPWFVVGFLSAAVLNTFMGFPAELSHSLVLIGKFMIVMAMVAIGLNTHLIKLLRNGIRPILLGLSCWFAVAIVSLVVQRISGMW